MWRAWMVCIALFIICSASIECIGEMADLGGASPSLSAFLNLHDFVSNSFIFDFYSMRLFILSLRQIEAMRLCLCN